MITRILYLLLGAAYLWLPTTWAAPAYEISQSSGCLDAVGRYSPDSVDAGIILDLAKDKTFVANWWAQDMKNQKIVRGRIVGKWQVESGYIILTFSAGASKDGVCKFQLGKSNGRKALILEKGAEFPFNAFFGSVYFSNDCASHEG